MGRCTPRSPSPFLPTPQKPTECIRGSQVEDLAPAATRALLRSSHWSGRPKNHWFQRVRCLCPGGWAVPVSRKFQHAARPGCTHHQRRRRAWHDPSRFAQALVRNRVEPLLGSPLEDRAIASQPPSVNAGVPGFWRPRGPLFSTARMPQQDCGEHALGPRSARCGAHRTGQVDTSYVA